MFGKSGSAHRGRPLTENDVFEPMSPYGAAKLYGYFTTRIYREAYGMFAVNGILFNHESPIRGLEFVSRKITNGASKIACGLSKGLELGNLDSNRDWGFAPEYVEAMWQMLQAKIPEDYVIATNESHSVREFVENAFKVLGLDWKQYVKVDKRFFRPLDTPALTGNPSKAVEKLSWSPRTHFVDLVKIMVNEDYARWKRSLNGEHFPWDATNHPEEARIMTRAMRM
jgi:GDPmannose 4,6-dehydratase